MERLENGLDFAVSLIRLEYERGILRFPGSFDVVSDPLLFSLPSRSLI